MKKSTLITTIAMIVVVVVALSTATYAWFTSSTTNYVTDTMQTTAQSGWYLYGGSGSAITTTTNNQLERSITYSQTAQLSLNLLNKGLYSPAKALSTTLTSTTDLAATYTDTEFFGASQNGFGVLNTAKVTTAASLQHNAAAPGAQEADMKDNLNAIRIVNGKGSDEHCYLTILVSIEDPTTQEMVAGREFKFLIVTTAGYFTTGYWYATAVGELNAEATKTSDSKIGMSESGVTYAPAKSAGVVQYSTVSNEGGADFAGNAKHIANNAKYYTIAIDLGQINAGVGLNAVFYAWFDGWALDTTAQGGSVDITLSFGDQVGTVVNTTT